MSQTLLFILIQLWVADHQLIIQEIPWKKLKHLKAVIHFPEKPEKEEKTLVSNIGKETHTLFTVDLRLEPENEDVQRYVFESRVYPKDKRDVDKNPVLIDRMYDDALADLASKFGGSQSWQKEITISEQPAREAMLLLEDETVRVRLVAKSNKLYICYTFRLNDFTESENEERFFESFVLSN